MAGDYAGFNGLLKYCREHFSPYKHTDEKGLSYEDRIEQQLDQYYDVLYKFNNEHFIHLGSEKKAVLRKVEAINHLLRKLTKNFYRGEIITALTDFKSFFKIEDFPTTELPVLRVEKRSPHNRSIWYRMRERDSYYLLDKEQMFHIPLDQRFLVGNQRYSISGFPCLYLGKSVYICWAKLTRPHIYTANVVSVENTLPLQCLDMRIPKRITNINQLFIIPLIIATSQRVERNGTFKPEYILSQFTLQNLIDNNRKLPMDKIHQRIHGIIYTSTRIGEDFKMYDDESLYENLVIPTVAMKQSNKHHLCKQLCDEFKISNPTSVNLININETPFSVYLSEGGPYETSIFGNLHLHLNFANRHFLDPDTKPKIPSQDEIRSVWNQPSEFFNRNENVRWKVFK